MEDLLHQRQAAAAARRGVRGRLDGKNVEKLFTANGLADCSLGHVVAGADLAVVRHFLQRVGVGLAFAEQQASRSHGERLVALEQSQHAIVVRRVADEDSFQHPRAVVAYEQLLIDAVEGIFVDDRLAARRKGHVVAEAGHVHAQQLELSWPCACGRSSGSYP